MHKFFAKTLFLGKKLVFLPQCHSTNDELSHLAKNPRETEGTVVYTDHQLKGKGQRGHSWEAESQKNLLFSLLLRPKWKSILNQFYLNLVAGLSIHDCLLEYIGVESLLKWPNDVYVGDQKIAGILIETNLKGHSVESAIVGIGLNVNQSGFNLPTATSLQIETGKTFDQEDLLEELLVRFEKWYLKLKAGDHQTLLRHYYDKLMWKGELRTFENGGETFDGKITGIDEAGRLLIDKQNGMIQSFGIKEVRFIG